jgi:phosphatidate phosphatase APP1
MAGRTKGLTVPLEPPADERHELPPWLTGLISLEDSYTAWRRALRMRLGIARRLRIVPYRGYGTLDKVFVRARVLEDRRRSAPATHRLAKLYRSYLRYATLEEPHAEVAIEWRDEQLLCRADDEGFVELAMKPPEGIEPGWHALELTLQQDPRIVARAQVLVVHPDARHVIVSDIDDTLIDVGVSNLWKRFRSLFLREADQRIPFEGAPAFYRALLSGYRSEPANPLLFVSSSPYNLHELLEDFFSQNDVPAAPLLLRDWGLTRHGFAPGGGHGHKRRAIEELLELFPQQSFVLVGDSSQEDAEHYLGLTREHPKRIAAVYLRLVSQSARRRQEVVRRGEAIAHAGTPLCAFVRTEEALEHARALGLIDAGVADGAKLEAMAADDA